VTKLSSQNHWRLWRDSYK